MKSYCLLTNDIETTSIWHGNLNDDTGLKVLKEGMPLLLDLYEKYDIKTTFFFTGYIAKLYPEIVKMVVPYGHEVGSHGMSHNKKDGFDIMPLKKQINHLNESKKILEDLSGTRVVSFRAPALRINNNTAIALNECEYLIDSSVASQRFDVFMSSGSFKKLNWLTAPRLPYRTSPDSLLKKGNSSIIEVPVSAAIVPYISTMMRASPFITLLNRKILAYESSKTGKPIVFITHPNEFIDETHEKRIVSKDDENYFKTLFQQTLRTKIKIRNIGKPGIELYDKEIDFFLRKKFIFSTISSFCKEWENL